MAQVWITTDANGNVTSLYRNAAPVPAPAGMTTADDSSSAVQAFLNGTQNNQLWKKYQHEAQMALSVTDTAMHRIAEGVALGTCAWINADVVAYVNYRKALRAILSQAQPAIIPTALPTKPAYPQGT